MKVDESTQVFVLPGFCLQWVAELLPNFRAQNNVHTLINDWPKSLDDYLIFRLYKCYITVFAQ